ncbi:MAG: hypothetical protein ACTIL3_12095 [Brevibacterium aurantiacum]
MTSEAYTLLLGAGILCAWGSLGVVAKSMLRGQSTPEIIWMVLGGSAVFSLLVWLFFRAKGAALEIKAFLGSKGLGAALIGVYAASFVVPGLIAQSSDVVDLVFTAVVIAVIAGLALFLLRKTFFTPPDTPEGID